jgi:hypothetical protein
MRFRQEESVGIKSWSGVNRSKSETMGGLAVSAHMTAAT